LEAAHAVAAWTAVNGADLWRLAPLTLHVAAGRGTILGAIGDGLAGSADVVAADGAIHGAELGILSVVTDSVATRRHAVHGAVLRVL